MNYVRFIMPVVAVVAVLFAAPFAFGVGWSVVGVPLYGLACSDWHGIINGSTGADDYRIFLANRGCNLKDEIRKIVAKDFSSDLSRLDDLVAMVSGETTPSSDSDILTRDLIRRELRELRPIAVCGHLNRENAGAAGRPGVPADEAGCWQPRWHSDDLMGRLFSYLGNSIGAYLTDGFADGLNWGADTLTGLAATGPVMRALLGAACAIIVVLPFGPMVVWLIKRIRQTSI